MQEVKRIIISSLVVLFGIIAIAGGFSKLGDSTVRCGGRIMQSGDECVSTSTTGSETGRKSVDEQQSSDKAGTWAAMGGGVLIVVFGGKSLWTGIRNRRKKPGEGTPAGAAGPPVPGWNQPPPGPAQYQPPQGYQPQQAPPAQYQPPQAPPGQYPAPQAANPPAWNQPPQQQPSQQYPPQPGWGPPPRR
ncbi:hypothetical protein [Amycolatopsis sp. NPDC051061]|uniref:hypothetical protein n=1 Tax=Amycolatopsis sp. NPDC051061 TaxID=3155042 RepID=UPI00343191E2